MRIFPTGSHHTAGATMYLRSDNVKSIIIKIRLRFPVNGTLLNDLSRLLEQYLKNMGIPFGCIDASVKFDENE